MAATPTYIGGLCTNAFSIYGGEMQGDVSFATGKSILPDKSTATATAGAATLSTQAGTITSETLSTAKDATYTLTLTNTLVSTSSVCFASVRKGTATTGTPQIVSVAPTSNTLTVVVKNIDAADALNGTIKIAFFVI